MKYELWFDEANHLVRAKVLYSLTVNEVEQMMSGMKNLLEKNNTRKGIMDLSQANTTSINKETRQVYRRYANILPLDKAAIVVNSPVIRMIAKVVLSTLGKDREARFFTTEQQAFAWLMEPNQATDSNV